MAPPDARPRPDTPPDLALRHIVADCHADLMQVSRRGPARAGGPSASTRRAWRCAACARPSGCSGAPSTGRSCAALAAEAKWLAGECGPARDLHVFLHETVEDVPPVVKRVASRLATRAPRARPHRPVGRPLRELPAPARGLHELAPAASHRAGWTRSPVACSTGATTRSCTAAASSRSLGSERLHRLRIAIKKLRYAADFLQPAFASRAARPYIEATVRLQGALGALNDRAVAAQCWPTSRRRRVPART